MSYKTEIENALDECNLDIDVKDMLCERIVKTISSRLMVMKVVGDERMLRQESDDQVQINLFNALAKELYRNGIYIYSVEDGIPTLKIQVSRF